jgi:hypothetical protein
VTVKASVFFICFIRAEALNLQELWFLNILDAKKIRSWLEWASAMPLP